MKRMKLTGVSLAIGLTLLMTNGAFAQKSIFNGKNLKGWKIYGTEKWFVEDGLLVCESGPDKGYGYFATEKTYKDFDLTLEFQQEANGNSGVFFRSSIEGTKITGWQAEVAPPGHDTGGIYESYGRGWLIKPDPEKDKALKMGEWNTMRDDLFQRREDWAGNGVNCPSNSRRRWYSCEVEKHHDQGALRCL